MIPCRFTVANGVIKFNEDGLFFVRVTLQYGRSGAGGVSWLYGRVLSSIDGVNYFQSGSTNLVKIDDANSDVVAQNMILTQLPGGVYAKFQLMRGSEGRDTGGLITELPLEGTWARSPSAEVSIRRFETTATRN